ncbi:MAG: hypothetical protein KDK62_01135 [Chlamydiia bacterium]|nr:hypothetical protein [Chlamydiia bacterium]
MVSISCGSQVSANPNFVHASRALKVVGFTATIVATVSTAALVILLAAPVLPAALLGAVALTGLTLKSVVIIGLFSAGVAVICRVALNRLPTPSSGSCKCPSKTAPAGSVGGDSSSSSSSTAQVAAGADGDDASGGIPSPQSSRNGSLPSSGQPSVEILQVLAASLSMPPRSPSPPDQASENPSVLVAPATMIPSVTAAQGESGVALEGDEDDSDDDGTGSRSSSDSPRQSSTHASPRQSPSASSDSVEAPQVDVKPPEPATPSVADAAADAPSARSAVSSDSAAVPPAPSPSATSSAVEV